MKKLMNKLMAVGLVLLACAAAPLVTDVQAADRYGVENYTSPSGYGHANLITNMTLWSATASNAYYIPAITTTNIPVAAATILPVPKGGFGLFVRTGGDSASSTTNLLVTLEGVVFPTGNRAGGTQVVDNATWVLSTPTTATALPTGYDYVTNFPGVDVVSGLVAALARCDGVRIKSIQNTNASGAIWVSNLFTLRDPVQ